jgi:hypothetical protein
MDDLSVFGTILTEQVDETLDDVARQVVGTDAAARGDGRAHLFEVRGARVTRGEVLLESTALSTRECAVEIIAHEFNGLAAYER